MTQADPTIIALEDLDKPGKYKIRKSVPIFVEHVDKTTGEKVDRKRLEELAAINNRRTVETGTPGSILIGHTPGRKEEDLINVGFRKNYHVGRFGPKNKLGLLCDHYFKHELYQKAMSFPHRSIELWSDGTIDVVSLLARTPELDLGLLLPDDGPTEKHLATNDGCELMVYSRGGSRRIYQMNEVIPMTMQDLLEGFQAVIDKAKLTIEPQTFSAMPSGTNAALPEMVQYSKEAYDKQVKATEQLQIERDEAIRVKNETLKVYQKQTRTQTLQNLKAEGVLLEVDDEYADTESLDQAAFDKHIEKVKKCYARGAAAASFIQTEAPAKDADTEYARHREKTRAYAMRHHVGIQEAYEAVKSGKV